MKIKFPIRATGHVLRNVFTGAAAVAIGALNIAAQNPNALTAVPGLKNAAPVLALIGLIYQSAKATTNLYRNPDGTPASEPYHPK